MARLGSASMLASAQASWLRKNMVPRRSFISTLLYLLFIICIVYSDSNNDDEIFVTEPLIRTEYDLLRDYNLTRLEYMNQMKRASIKAKDILEHYPYYFQNSVKMFPNVNILAYVTPWNTAGYTMAKILHDKIQYLVPGFTFSLRNLFKS